MSINATPQTMLEIDDYLSDLECSTERAHAALQDITQRFFGQGEVLHLVEQNPMLYMAFDQAAPFAFIVEDYLIKILETLKRIRCLDKAGEDE